MSSSTAIDRIMQQACESGAIPGAVVMAATGGEVVYQDAFGNATLARMPR